MNKFSEYKSFLRPGALGQPKHVRLRDMDAPNEDKKTFDFRPTLRHIWINHYQVKSLEDYVRKMRVCSFVHIVMSSSTIVREAPVTIARKVSHTSVNWSPWPTKPVRFYGCLHLYSLQRGYEVALLEREILNMLPTVDFSPSCHSLHDCTNTEQNTPQLRNC